MPIPADVQQILASPLTGESLQVTEEGFYAPVEGTRYSYTRQGALDLRLQKPKTVLLELSIGCPEDFSEVSQKILRHNPHPEVDFSGVTRPGNINTQVLSYFPRAKSANSLAMDLGCGPANYRNLFEHAGFTYCGADFAHPDAPILADAQALPFKDNSFEFIWSGAMIQYIPYAYPMMREICRVLAPGGRFIGTVGYLEAFDGHSYHMYTRLGILSLLMFGGFDITVIAPDEWWTGLTAICSMGLFPRLPNSISHVLTAPLEFASRAYWRMASLKNPKHTEDERLAKVTAGFTFIVHKPVDIPGTRDHVSPA